MIDCKARHEPGSSLVQALEVSKSEANTSCGVSYGLRRSRLMRYASLQSHEARGFFQYPAATPRGSSCAWMRASSLLLKPAN